MTISELIANLRLDLSDTGKELFLDVVLERCVRKAIFRVGQDLDTTFMITEDLINPAPDQATLHLVSILSQINACQVMRAATANNFSFSSADKRVDKSGQASQWAKLEEDLQEQYTQSLRILRPQSPQNGESYFITIGNVSPVIYEQGGRLQEDDGSFRESDIVK